MREQGDGKGGRKRARRLAAALALLGGLVPAAHADRQSLVWYTFNLPPLYISSGPHAGDGVIDRALQKQLIPHMPAFDHRIEDVPLPRAEQLVRIQPNACVLGLLKNPDREAAMLFSEPFLVQLPLGVLARRSDAARLRDYQDGEGRVSLARLLADGKLTVGISAGRSYGTQVDDVLQRFRGRNNVTVNSSASPVRNLLQMTQLGRVDVMPAFAFEMTFHDIGTGTDESGLRFYPLLEQPDYLTGYAACSKSEIGAKAIRKINAALGRPGTLDAIAASYESWLDEDARALAKRLRKRALGGG